MHFDDRLATVLRHRASGESSARTQFRQLLDLLGSRRHGRDDSLLAAAWLRLGALGEMLPADERASMIREAGWRFRNPELALHLAEDEPEVAVAALGKAELDGEDWAALIPHLPVRARGLLRFRRDLPREATAILDRLGVHDRGLPMPEVVDLSESDVFLLDDEADPIAQANEPAPLPARPRPVPANDSAPLPDRIADPGDESAIGALVRRIEAFQKARVAPRLEDDSPRLPLGEKQAERAGEPLVGFAFTTDAEGRIDWAEAAVAPMVVGTRLRERDAERFDRRQPIRLWPVELDGAPAIAGEWVVDASPRFTDPGGRYYGHAGKFRRPVSATDGDTSAVRDSEGDRIRQLLHELRTPVNAIQGFAEVIQQQLFGPAPHEYRALAAGIAGDAARILAGFDELDRLAKLESGALELEPGECDLAAVLVRISEHLQGVLKSRAAGFSGEIAEGECRVAIQRGDAEALAWRVLATFAGTVGAGERLLLQLSGQGTFARVDFGLPSSLAARDDLFSSTARPATGSVSAGAYGAGFALRLARAEARAAGGDLVRDGDILTLTLPLLTAPCAAPSPHDARAEEADPAR